jgi:DNA-binding GntR family transcriptional regulator
MFTYFVSGGSGMNVLCIPLIDIAGKLPMRDVIHRRVRRALIVGSIQPGQSVTISALSQAMNSSPTPVREALRCLTSEGALTVLHNRRLVVPPMTPERFNELLSVRLALEQYAAREAVYHITENQVERLDALNNEKNCAVRHQCTATALLKSYEFRLALYGMTSNASTFAMLTRIWLQLGPFVALLTKHFPKNLLVDRQVEIVQALRKRDGDAVSRELADELNQGIGKLEKSVIRELSLCNSSSR